MSFPRKLESIVLFKLKFFILTTMDSRFRGNDNEENSR